MSGYHSPTDEYAAHATEATRINDPLDGGLIDLASKSGGILTITGGGTRTLPSTPKGISLLAYADGDAVDLVDAEGSVFHLEDGDWASAISLGNGTWGGITFPGTVVDNIRQSRLGTIAIDPNDTDSTLSAAIGAANIEKLNAWTEFGFANNRRVNLDMVARSLAFGGTESWDTQLRDGFAIECSGGGVAPRSENQFGDLSETTDAFYAGGLNSRFVWVDQANATGAMITSRGYGLNIKGNLTLQGKHHLLDPTTLKASSTNQKQYGIELLGRDADGQVPSGKIEGSLTCAMLDTGIITLPTPFEDNADQLLLDRFVVHYCGRGFYSTNKQALGNRFAYIDQFHTPIGIEYASGGKHWTGTHCIQAGCDVGLKITGNDTTTFGSFDIDKIIVDGTSDNDCLAVQVAPASGSCAATINIQHLDIDYAITGRTSNPVISLVSYYGRFNLFSGTGLYERMIHVTGGTQHFHPTIYIQCGSFRDGVDLNNASIRDLFTASSTGWLNLVFIYNNQVYNNSAQLYENYAETIEINSSDSTIVVH